MVKKEDELQTSVQQKGLLSCELAVMGSIDKKHSLRSYG